MKKLIAIVLLHVCICLNVNGQTFKAQALLPAIEQDGFYRINLNPQLAPYINDNYSNIRIHDRANREVPYFIQPEEGTTSVVTF